MDAFTSVSLYASVGPILDSNRQTQKLRNPYCFGKSLPLSWPGLRTWRPHSGGKAPEAAVSGPALADGCCK